jgi:hypothetical protein
MTEQSQISKNKIALDQKDTLKCIFFLKYQQKETKKQINLNYDRKCYILKDKYFLKQKFYSLPHLSQ